MLGRLQLDRQFQMNKIFSRNFESRKEGLAEAREIVQNANDENSRAVFDAMVFVLGKALRDPLYSVRKADKKGPYVYQVYSEALDLLKVTVCEFMPRHQMQKNGSAIAATTVEPLLAKMGNTAGVCLLTLCDTCEFRTRELHKRRRVSSGRSSTATRKFVVPLSPAKHLLGGQGLPASSDELRSEWKQGRESAS